jgi:cytochrome oxidase Cu insertion factor (SCO1/SenC/PrrC family)
MRKPRQLIRGILPATMACLLLAGTAQALEVGQKAPDFSLTAPDGKPVKLADLLGKGPVVIFTFIQGFGGA